MGALDYFPNVDAAFHLVNTIMPAVWARGPDIRLIIAGRHPDPSLSSLLADPRVQMVANPEDMRSVAAQASVSAVPLRNGAGTRVKILQSLAWGLPVISTQLGCAGLSLTDGEGLVIRDDPEAFAEAVVRSLTDAGLWRRLSSAGRALVEQRYGWEPLLERFEAELYRFVDGPVPTHASPPRPE
jgi:glycosyltransferase involved in cell wall biosynthesis